MAVFDAIKAAVLRAEGAVITQAYSDTSQIGVEMADLANECAADMAKSHDWRALTKTATFTGDGVALAFPKPADYDRMTGGAIVADATNWLWGYTPFASVDEWLEAVNEGSTLLVPGGWIILGGDFQFYPAPSGNAVFPYQSSFWARDEDGTPKPRFDADNDDFCLDPRLLTLALIWRWKAQKGMDYSEDMETYEIALSQAQARDAGARVIASGRPNRLPGARMAYPWVLG